MNFGDVLVISVYLMVVLFVMMIVISTYKRYITTKKQNKK